METAHSEFWNVREIISGFHLTLETDFLVLQDAHPKLGAFVSLIPKELVTSSLVSAFYCFTKKTVIYT